MSHAYSFQVCVVQPTSRSTTANLGISSDIKTVCCRLVEDYGFTATVPLDDSSSFLNTSMHQFRRSQQQRVLADLSALAPGLLPYIIAAAMNTFDWFVAPPLSLLEIFTEWICTHPKLILKPFKEAAAGKAMLSSPPPFFRGLSQGLGKLVALSLLSASDESSPASALYARLQLGLLRLMEAMPKGVPWPQGLSTMDTPCSIMTARMVADLMKLIHQQSQQASIQNACYALFRALQMAVATRCYSGTKRELEQALSTYLIDYPFLEFVVGQQF